MFKFIISYELLILQLYIMLDENPSITIIVHPFFGPFLKSRKLLVPLIFFIFDFYFVVREIVDNDFAYYVGTYNLRNF